MTEKEVQESETGFTPKQTEFIKSVFGADGIFSRPIGSQAGMNPDDAKQLEAIKWVLTMISNKDFIKSATNLPAGVVDDLSDAEMINSYADSPELDEYIKSTLELYRSRVEENSPYSNVLQLLSKMSGLNSYSFDNLKEQGRLLGKLR